MRLIDAPIGIFRFDGELVLKTEYYSKNKQSGKYIPDCYIIRTGEYFWGSAKTANELINLDIEPVDFEELLPTVTDTISRQAAIDMMLTALCDGWDLEYAEMRMRQLPPAEEESFEWCTDCKEYDQEKHCCHRWTKVIRNTVEEIRGTTAVGEWVIVHGFCTPGGDPVWKCSNCGKGMHVYGVEHGSYGADIADNQWVACPNCGAVMIGERYE